MQEMQKNQKKEMVMAWLAVAVLLVILISVLLCPFIQGKNIGKVYGEVFNNQIYHEYEYDSDEDYYYPSETRKYDDDYDFDDSGYRRKAEKEDKKIRRDVKHLEEFEDSVTFADEVRLLTKYIKYVVKADEDELISFRYSFVITVLILLMAAVLAVYLLVAFIRTLLNLLKKKIDINKIQRRLCRVLFFLIPYIIMVNWQSSLTVNVFFKRSYLYGALLQAKLGLGCVLPCVLIVIYLILYWGIRVHSHLKGGEPVERLLINRLAYFIMMVVAGGVLLLNFDTALYSGSGMTASADLAAESAYCSSSTMYAYETYELEHEKDDDEEDDDEGFFEKNKSKREHEFEKMDAIYKRRMAAGIFILLGIMVTVKIICSINAATYLNQDVIWPRVWAGLNVVLYLAAYLFLLRSNKLELDAIEDFASKSEKVYLTSSTIGRAVILPIVLNAFLIVADIWRKYINRALDRRNNVTLPIQDEEQEIQE